MRMTFAAPAVLMVLAGLIGCSSSSSVTKEDAGHDAGHDSSTGTKDSGESHDAGVDTSVTEDAGVDAPVEAGSCNPPGTPIFALDAGTTWSSLYRDYFGPTGTASCAGTEGNCHGSTTGNGYGASHFLCPMGADSGTGCYAGITSLSDAGPYLIQPDASFANDDLSGVLCQDCGNIGSMPFNCSYIFTTTDIARISAWIAAGAPDN